MYINNSGHMFAFEWEKTVEMPFEGKNLQEIGK